MFVAFEDYSIADKFRTETSFSAHYLYYETI